MWLTPLSDRIAEPVRSALLQDTREPQPGGGPLAPVVCGVGNGNLRVVCPLGYSALLELMPLSSPVVSASR